MSDDDQLVQVREWANEVATALAILAGAQGPTREITADEIDAVLGIAGLAARTSVRPAAPVTTYLLGYAVGRAEAAGADRREAFAAAGTALRAFAQTHRDDPPGAPE